MINLNRQSRKQGELRRYTAEEVRQDLRSRCVETSQQSVALETGFTPAFINDVVHGRRDMTQKLALALGYRIPPDVYERIK